MTNYHELGNIDSKHLKNEKLMLMVIKNDGRALQYANDDMRKDPIVVLGAINIDEVERCGLRYAHNDLKNDEKFLQTLKMIYVDWIIKRLN